MAAKAGAKRNGPTTEKREKGTYVPQNPIKAREGVKHRMKTDALFSFSSRLRRSILRRLKRGGVSKNKRTEEMIGCSFSDLRKYIESLFEPGMNWSNRGFKGWHLDHTVPLAVAKDSDDLHRLWHHSNLRPVWWYDNLRKSDILWNGTRMRRHGLQKALEAKQQEIAQQQPRPGMVPAQPSAIPAA